MCYKSGVQVVTVYAFSIENFKRSKFEVDALMDMAKVKLTEMGAHGELLDRYGARIQFLGNKDMIRPDVLDAIEKAIDMTSSNHRAVLNICAPYTSRDEMTAAVRETVVSYSRPITPLKRPFSQTHIARNIRNQQLGPVSEETSAAPSANDPDHLTPASFDLTSHPSSRTASPHPSATSQASHETSPTTAPSDSHSPNYPDPETITADTINSHTFTAGMPPLDLLVRTSGVERLSDFMLWQCHQHTDIVFVDCLWPEFDLWKFLPIIVEWQWRRQRGYDAEPSRLRRKQAAP
ncbi:MAG: undecaprenyl diphosphate synthase family protein, partial [Terriglobus roseus]|nr:undecaprenyl diphosphate synthase family protein [Terriglobus roseus]